MKYKLPLGMAVIVVMLLAACNNLFDAPSDQLPAGYGRVSINITGGETERTVLPATGLFDSVKYFFKKGSEAEKEIQPETANGNTFKLENGTYTVRIEAYVGTTKVAEGTSASFTVATSGTTPNPVTVKLNPNETVAAKGKFKYNFSVPTGATLAISLKKWPALANDELNDTAGNGEVALDAGSYVLTVTVSKGILYAGIVDAVHIYPSMTTTYPPKTYTDNDLIKTQQIYTVTFDKNGGDTEANPQTKEVKTPPATKVDPLPTAPTRAGYNFMEWNTKADGTGSKFDTSTEVNETNTTDKKITVYAKWGQVDTTKYQVNFNKNHSDSTGSTEANPTFEQVAPGGSVTPLPTAPTRQSYDFSKWNTKADGTGEEFTTSSKVPDAAPTEETRNYNVYARWTYTVKYNDNKGSGTLTGTVPADDKKDEGTSTTIDAGTELELTESGSTYSFKNWNTLQGGTGTSHNGGASYSGGNTTLYAQWEYKVDYDVNGGTGTVPPAQTADKGGTAITLAAGTGLAKIGNVFDGWNTKADGTGTTYAADASYSGGNTTLYVKWTPTFTVTFDTDGGSPAPEKQTVASGGKATKPDDPTKAFFTFGGWFDNTTPWDFDTNTVTSDINLKAKWEANGPTDLKITVDGTVQEVVVNVEGGTKEYNEGHTGYTFTQSAGYANSYAYFQVDFGTGKLSDYEKVSFKIVGVKGDIGYKNVPLKASDTEFSDALGNTTVHTGWFNSWPSPAGSIQSARQMNETTPLNNVLILDKAKTDTFNTNDKLYFAICIGASATGNVGGTGVDTTYTVSDIIFVKGTGAGSKPATASKIWIEQATNGSNITGNPSKTIYDADDTFNPAGLKIFVDHYFGATTTDGYRETVAYNDTTKSKFTFSAGGTPLTVGTSKFSDDTTITVTYEEQTATFNITSGTPPASGIPITDWEPTITSTTDINGSGEYIGQTGIKRDSNADQIAFGVIDGGFTVIATSGTYKQFCVQVGSGAGGTAYWASDGFTASVDTEYTITFMASVASGTGQIRLNANGKSGDPWDKSENLDTTPKAVTFTWTHASGNFHFDTGSTPITSVITITNIVITSP